MHAIVAAQAASDRPVSPMHECKTRCALPLCLCSEQQARIFRDPALSSVHQAQSHRVGLASAFNDPPNASCVPPPRLLRETLRATPFLTTTVTLTASFIAGAGRGNYHKSVAVVAKYPLGHRYSKSGKAAAQLYALPNHNRFTPRDHLYPNTDIKGIAIFELERRRPDPDCFAPQKKHFRTPPG